MVKSIYVEEIKKNEASQDQSERYFSSWLRWVILGDSVSILLRRFFGIFESIFHTTTLLCSDTGIPILYRYTHYKRRGLGHYPPIHPKIDWTNETDQNEPNWSPSTKGSMKKRIRPFVRSSKAHTIIIKKETRRRRVSHQQQTKKKKIKEDK